ncbi:MAG: DUF362 domain-containing protein [Desulfobacteraceae bacterium]|nr:DUF362 domain-containing protein [Desulfobacteraceae bacterium]
MTSHHNRRQFLKKSGRLTVTAAATLLMGNGGGISALATASSAPDLVAVKNGEPHALFDAAIKAAGGMGRYVQKGQTVVIKPNIGWNREPEYAANTNPALVQRIIEHCVNAGAKKIYVFDHSVDHGQRCYKSSGIESAAKSSGALMVPGDHERYYQEVVVPGGQKLKKTKVHELILESDVYINVPVLKHHGSSGLTLAMKNQMGVVWNRGEYHWRGLHQCIADFCRFRKPDLNIIDAYRITLRNGPQRAGADDVVMKKTLLLSPNIVAIDAAAAKIFGKDPQDISHIYYGHHGGIGNMDLNGLNIKRITLPG